MATVLARIPINIDTREPLQPLANFLNHRKIGIFPTETVQQYKLDVANRKNRLSEFLRRAIPVFGSICSMLMFGSVLCVLGSLMVGLMSDLLKYSSVAHHAFHVVVVASPYLAVSIAIVSFLIWLEGKSVGHYYWVRYSEDTYTHEIEPQLGAMLFDIKCEFPRAQVSIDILHRDSILLDPFFWVTLGVEHYCVGWTEEPRFNSYLKRSKQ